MSARRRIAAGLIGLVGVLLLPAPAQAHPLGNFTTNQYAGLRVTPSAVDADYVLDLAELPTYQARSGEIDTDSDGTVSAAEQSAWATRTCAAAASAAQLTVNGRAVPMSSRPGLLTFRPAAGGLTTLRLECVLHGPATITGPASVTFTNGMFPDRIGWRETTAVGDRMTLTATDVPAASVSALLTAYPAGTAGLNERSASLTVKPGGPAAAPAPFTAAGGDQARDVDRFTAWFTDLVGHPQLTVGVGLLAFLIALVLGGSHAVAPGHGKTIMAAYLVGNRGRLPQALVVAGTVAATHTVGVLLLGVVLATSLQLAPDTMYEWLRLTSGILVAAVGAHLLSKALPRARRLAALSHTHSPDLTHDLASPHDHDAAHDHGLVTAHGHGLVTAHDRATLHDHDHATANDHGLVTAHDHGHATAHDHHHGPVHQHDHDVAAAHDHGLVTAHDHGHAYNQGHADHDHRGEPALLEPALLGAALHQHTHDQVPSEHSHDHSHDAPHEQHTHDPALAGHAHDQLHDTTHHQHIHEPALSGHTHSHDAGHGHERLLVPALGESRREHEVAAAAAAAAHGHGSAPTAAAEPADLVAVGQANVALPGHIHATGRLEEHSHGGGRPHTHHIPGPEEQLSLRTLLAMGFAGGLSPSPSAVVVLLGAAALGRAWYGVLLVLAYGIGLAATLIGIGFALARWGDRLRFTRSARWNRLLTHRLPTATASVILAVGLGMVAVAATELLH